MKDEFYCIENNVDTSIFIKQLFAISNLLLILSHILGIIKYPRTDLNCGHALI